MIDAAPVHRLPSAETFPTTARCRVRCRTCSRWEQTATLMARQPSSRSTLFISNVYVFFLIFCFLFLHLQPHHRAADDRGIPAVHAHSDDIHSIIHRIKSTEILHRLHVKLSERVRTETVNSQRALRPCINTRTCTIYLPLRVPALGRRTLLP